MELANVIYSLRAEPKLMSELMRFYLALILIDTI